MFNTKYLIHNTVPRLIRLILNTYYLPRRQAGLILFLVLTTFYLILTPAKALAATVTWDGGAGTSEWNTATNWSNDAVPTSSDTVTIDNAAVTATTTAINFSTLTIGSGTNTSSLTLTTNIGTGGSITINNAGTLTQNNKVQQSITGTLTINSGGNLTHTSNTTANTYNVNFSAATITVNSSGTINVNGKGYQNTAGPGGGTVYGGGSHGGKGGRTTNTSSTNDSVTNPIDLGSGGANVNNPGSSGGGVVILTVSGTLTVDGTISVNGNNGSGDGSAGAGGTVNITAGTFTGSGNINANGGTATGSNDSSGGGGGRIKIGYATDSSSVTITAYGGGPTSAAASGSARTPGSAGTIYKVDTDGPTNTNGILIIDNNSVSSWNAGAGLESGNTYSFDDVQLKNKGQLDVKFGATLTLPNSYTNTNGDANGVLINNGTIDFSGSSYTLNGYILWANYHSGTQFTSLTSLTIGSTGVLSHGYNNSSKTNYINTSFTTLTVTGSINVDGKGYMPRNGPGAGTGTGGGGGGHGGKGGYINRGGASNDSVTDPTDLGSSGGWNNSEGGTGGGAIILTVSGTFTNNGSITAAGGTSSGDGGGAAGGTINLTAGTLAGTGTTSANGASSSQTGGGGGGRIKIGYATDSSSLTITAYGASGAGNDNSGYGGPGTIYKVDTDGPTNTNGILIVDNNSLNSWNQGAGLESGNTYSFDDVRLKNKGRLDVKFGATLTLSNSYTNTNGDTTGIIINNGTIDFSGSSYTLNGYILWANYHSGTQFTSLTSLTIGSTGVLSHGYNNTSKTNYLSLSLTNLTNSSGSINVIGKGYIAYGSGGSGPGGGTWVGGGGGHGGVGGYPGKGGPTYDSITNPDDLGSAGANTNAVGATGGGLVILTITNTLTNNGTISVNGNTSSGDEGAGAGGTINITAGIFTGTGTMTANGGTSSQTGGGGGGRIAISITTNSYTGTITTNGGSGGGGIYNGLDGTIYFGSPTFSNVTVTANANASATISGVKTIAFWVKPSSNAAKMIQLASGVDISSTATPGTLSSNGITSPTYYVNGVAATTITADTWNHVVVTTNQGITANSILLGQMSAGYLGGQLDDVRVYTSEYSSSQVSTLYSDSNTILANLTLSSGSEQAGPAPLVYYKFDEGTGTTTQDSSGNGITATLAGNTIPTWQTENNCTSGKCLYLDGSTSKLTISSVNNVSSIKSVGLWVKPTSVTSLALIDLDGGTHKITVASGVISATGFTSPTIYVNGKQTTTLSASSWSYVEVTTTTGFNPTTALTLGNSAATYLTGYLDEVKLYNYTRSANQVLTDYAGKKAPIGASMIITPASYSSGQAPIGHWRMDEGSWNGTSGEVKDSSGNGNNGTGSGGVTTTNVGKYGKAGSFDGTDDYITCSNASCSNLNPGTSNWTVGGWIKTSSTANAQEIVRKGTGGANDYMIRINQTTGYAFAYFVDSSVTVVSVTGTTSLADGNWHYVAATLNKSGNLTLYVDGKVNGTPASASSLGTISNSNEFVIGRRSDDNSEYFNGQIDDIRIYNYARTQKQVISDMMGDGARSPVIASAARQSSGGGPGGGPIGYYKFDEGYSTTANDSSGNSNNLTLSSASWTLAGKFNKAWNGTGSIWVSRADDSDFDIATTDDYTISFWFKSDSATNPSATEYLVNKADATTAGYAVYVNTSGNICIGIDDDTTWNPDISSCSPNDIYDNTWHHIVAVRDNSSTDKTVLYVDGVLKDTDTDSTTATLANSLSLYIGDRDGVDNGDEFNGDIDDVKFYRYILTAAEVKLDYNKGSAQTLGALSDKTGTGYESNQSANQEYCIPGDATSCAAPVGRWDFDENTGNTVYDKSGNNNTGTWNGTLGNQWKPGKNSPGGNFNGSDNYVRVTSSSSIQAITSAITIEFWMKDTGTATQEYSMKGALINNHIQNYGSPTSGIVLMQNSNGTLMWQLRPNNACCSTVNSNTVLSTNTWYHVAATWNGSTMAIYINGKLDNSGSASGTLAMTRDLFIGINADDFFNSGDLSNILSGQIDQVRIFNYARSAAQIAWDYNRGAPVGHYKFDECQGATAHDSSGNSNHGTINLSTTGTQTTTLGMGTCTTNASTPWYNGRTGKFNSSLNFDGTSDYIDLSNPASLRLTGAMTISAWVKTSLSGLQSPEYRDIVAKGGLGTTSSAYTFGIRFNGTNDSRAYMYWYDGSTVYGVEKVSPVIDNQQWHHVVGVRKTNYDVELYVDGLSIGTDAGNAVAVDGGQNVFIGKGSPSGAYVANDGYFSGQIDDVRVYNYALTGVQIKLLYNQNSGIRFGPSTGSP